MRKTVLLFDRNFPKSLLQSLQSIHSVYVKHRYEIDYDSNLLIPRTKGQIIYFLVDRAPKKLSTVTMSYLNDGEKVFALKLPKQEKLDSFEISLTVLENWRQILHTIENRTDPFIAVCKYKGSKLKLTTTTSEVTRVVNEVPRNLATKDKDQMEVETNP